MSNEKDLLILAKAVAEGAIWEFSGDRATFLYCNYCDAELHNLKKGKNKFRHKDDCPVLVAYAIIKEAKATAPLSEDFEIFNTA